MLCEKAEFTVWMLVTPKLKGECLRVIEMYQMYLVNKIQYILPVKHYLFQLTANAPIYSSEKIRNDRITTVACF